MKIIVDSGCDYSAEVIEKYDLSLESVPLHLQLDDTSYLDDESLDVNNYLKEMAECKTTPKSAAPTPESFLEKIKDSGSSYLVTITSALSSSYNNAVLAKKMYLEEIGNKFIHVFDSMSASTGQLQIAIKINEFLKNNMPDIEVVEKVTHFINDMRTFIILEKYDNLVKTGRVNPYIAKIGQLLNLKPICSSDKGNIVLSDKARGYKKAFTRLAEIISADKIDFGSRILGITHVACLKRALELKEEIQKRVSFKDVLIVEARGLCSNYADREGLIITY